MSTTTMTAERYSVRVMDIGVAGCPPMYAIDDQTTGDAVKYTERASEAVYLRDQYNAGRLVPPRSPYGRGVPAGVPAGVPPNVAEAVAAWEPPTSDEEGDMEPEAGEVGSDSDPDSEVIGTEVIIPGLDRIGLGPGEWSRG